MKKLFVALLALSFVGVALAQAEWHESGLLTAEIDGQHHEMRSYYAQVPADAGADIEDAAAREFAEHYAGTVQHTAYFNLHDEMTLGGFVLAPATIWVTIGVRTDADQSVDGQIEIVFGLDPETLEVLEDGQAVRYFPTDWNLSDFYALTEGNLFIDEIIDNGDNTMQISGRIAGQLSRQASVSLEHNPADVLEIEAAFDINPVAGQ